MGIFLGIRKCLGWCINSSRVFDLGFLFSGVVMLNYVGRWLGVVFILVVFFRAVVK